MSLRTELILPNVAESMYLFTVACFILNTAYMCEQLLRFKTWMNLSEATGEEFLNGEVNMKRVTAAGLSTH